MCQHVLNKVQQQLDSPLRYHWMVARVQNISTLPVHFSRLLPGGSSTAGPSRWCVFMSCAKVVISSPRSQSTFVTPVIVIESASVSASCSASKTHLCSSILRHRTEIHRSLLASGGGSAVDPDFAEHPVAEMTSHSGNFNRYHYSSHSHDAPPPSKICSAKRQNATIHRSVLKAPTTLHAMCLNSVPVQCKVLLMLLPNVLGQCTNSL